MRICLYTETALPKIGGQELVVDALAREFLALGHEPLVLAPAPRTVRTADHTLPYPVIRHPRFISTRHMLAWYTWWLRRAARRNKVDVLHCHSIYPCGYLAALCREKLQLPTVITSHGGDVNFQGRRLMKPGFPARYARSLAAADALISISKFTTEGFQRLYPAAANKMETIPNGVHLAPLRTVVARPPGLDPAIKPGRYFLFLGRLNLRKGVDVLVDALAQVPAGGPAELVIAGDGDERAKLVEQCAQRGLSDRVRFVGAVAGETKSWLLQNARFVVIPSRVWEAFPLVVLEAFAAGKPVIGTRIPGLADLIEDRANGLLVPSESPAALAQAIQFLRDDGQAAASYGAQSLRIVQHFDWRFIAQRHLELYETLVLRRTNEGRLTHPRREASFGERILDATQLPSPETHWSCESSLPAEPVTSEATPFES